MALHLLAAHLAATQRHPAARPAPGPHAAPWKVWRGQWCHLDALFELSAFENPQMTLVFLHADLIPQTFLRLIGIAFGHVQFFHKFASTFS